VLPKTASKVPLKVVLNKRATSLYTTTSNKEYLAHLNTCRYHDRGQHAADVREALQQLNAFAKGAGKAAIYRETSVQHFSAPTGDYDDAVRNNVTLVRATRVPGQTEWAGPSFCQARSTQATTWRNEQLRALAVAAPLVGIQPFEALTAPRWDLHAHPKSLPSGRGWATDCTHWCFSPRFFDLSIHDLYTVLSARLSQRRAAR